jgi:hypothetical protein
MTAKSGLDVELTYDFVEPSPSGTGSGSGIFSIVIWGVPVFEAKVIGADRARASIEYVKIAGRDAPLMTPPDDAPVETPEDGESVPSDTDFASDPPEDEAPPEATPEGDTFELLQVNAGGMRTYQLTEPIIDGDRLILGQREWTAPFRSGFDLTFDEQSYFILLQPDKNSDYIYTVTVKPTPLNDQVWEYFETYARIVHYNVDSPPSDDEASLPGDILQLTDISGIQRTYQVAHDIANGDHFVLGDIQFEFGGGGGNNHNNVNFSFSGHEYRLDSTRQLPDKFIVSLSGASPGSPAPTSEVWEYIETYARVVHQSQVAEIDN